MKSLKNTMILTMIVGVLVSMFLFTTGCGDNTNDNQDANSFANVKKTDISDFELKHGFGPVKKELNLGPIDKKLSADGEKIFESKCASCHKLDERYVGPAQRDVLKRVTPEFFMNMVLNPEENLEKHPHAKDMLAQYMQKMTNQNINLADARALLEYFRVLDQELDQTKQTK
jgi:cytochrome c